MHKINARFFCSADKCVIPGYCSDRAVKSPDGSGASFVPYSLCNRSTCEHRTRWQDGNAETRDEDDCRYED